MKKIKNYIEAFKILVLNMEDKSREDEEIFNLQTIITDFSDKIEKLRTNYPFLSKLETLRYKIEDLYLYIRYNIPTGLINLKNWVSIIWNDRDYDCNFLYKIIQFKLIAMATYHIKYGHTKSANKYASQMIQCSDLIQNLLDDQYDANESVKEIEKLDWKEAKGLEQQLRDRDLSLLFYIMKDHIEEWSD